MAALVAAAVPRYPIRDMTTLHASNVIAFVGTTNPARSRLFYETILGLSLAEEEPFALVFQAHGAMLRLSKVKELTAAPYTVLGWAVADIGAEVRALLDRGIVFERYSGLRQDALGICVFPNGDQVAWFKDPDGNILSITQFG